MASGTRAEGAPPRVGDCLTAAAAALARLPQASPRLEAELLLTEATGWTRTRLVAWPEQRLDSEAAARFGALLARRLAGEPLAYIRGRQAFWTLDLRVTRDTLIPRPETELLVEIALELPDPDRPRRFADLGTGSGAIAAAVASERPAWAIYATDRSAAALAVARGNLRDLGLTDVAAVRANWLAPFGPASLDLILSNPPYVAVSDPHLREGDLPYEPPAALASGPDGLADIRHIAAEVRRCLKPGGLVALEHGLDQGEAIRALLQAAGLAQVETRRDLSGHERVTFGFAPPGSNRLRGRRADTQRTSPRSWGSAGKALCRPWDLARSRGADPVQGYRMPTTALARRSLDPRVRQEAAGRVRLPDEGLRVDAARRAQES